MKKIIATVLAMVMALALCTTAFAATSYTDAYKWNASKNTWEKVDLDGASISYTNPTETKVDGKFTSGTRGYYTVTLKGEAPVSYVEATDNANFRMTVDGTVKTLRETSSPATPYQLVGTEVETGTGKCGNIVMTATDAKLYKSGDKYYVAGSDKYMLLDNGALVNVKEAKEGENADYTIQPHQFEITSTAKDSKGVVTGTAKCKYCDQTASVTNKASAIPSGAKTQYIAAEGLYLFWTEGTSASTGTTTTTTTSPKTFDAGIAMYVGMALTSVAGSAVVIGKKKEF